MRRTAKQVMTRFAGPHLLAMSTQVTLRFAGVHLMSSWARRMAKQVTTRFAGTHQLAMRSVRVLAYAHGWRPIMYRTDVRVLAHVCLSLHAAGPLSSSDAGLFRLVRFEKYDRLHAHNATRAYIELSWRAERRLLHPEEWWRCHHHRVCDVA